MAYENGIAIKDIHDEIQGPMYENEMQNNYIRAEIFFKTLNVKQVRESVKFTVRNLKKCCQCNR